jgi:hypothetical protein
MKWEGMRGDNLVPPPGADDPLSAVCMSFFSSPINGSTSSALTQMDLGKDFIDMKYNNLI